MHRNRSIKEGQVYYAGHCTFHDVRTKFHNNALQTKEYDNIIKCHSVLLNLY